MSAGNAFAAAKGNKQEHSDMERPTKRARTAQSLAPPVWTRCAQEDTSLDVDIMILDYSMHQAITSCLASRDLQQSRTSSSLKTNLQLVNSFTPIFKSRHPHYRPDDELRLRMLLVKFIALFTQRFTLNPTTPDLGSLQALRQSNRERARSWHSSTGRTSALPDNTGSRANTTSLPRRYLETNRAHVLQKLGVPAEDEDYEDAFYGTSSCVSLLDLLPLFMQASAASITISGGNLTEGWMRLAAEFMLQASLEQFLVYGAQGADVLDQASAWGYEDGDNEGTANAHDTKDHSTEINDMFEDADHAEEVAGWTAIKDSYLSQLTLESEPDADGDPCSLDRSCLEAAAAAYPIAKFEASVLRILEALSKSIPTPVLTQVENGCLDGMTVEQTRAFIVNCGIDPADILAMFADLR